MDFSETAPQLRVTLDKLMIRVFSDQWLDMRNRREQTGGLSDKCGMDVERLRGWSRELEKGEKVFRRELRIARKQIEERAELAVRPSRDLEDYSLTTIISAGFRGPTSTSLPTPSKLGLVSSEKQGWLNLRTITGKPSKIVWVRRWFYVKNGIFGWLVQGSRSGGVEESERIGVLLCSVRALTEDEHRHYCFEVKTKDISTLLQAETQLELIEWMTSFEMAKQKALEDSTTINTAIPHAQDAAFAISPPYAPEFSASAADLGVQQLSDDTPGASFDRSGTLPLPGGESSLNLVNRGSFDVNGHRRSFAAEKDNDSLREHGSRILQKLDLHRKSAGGPPGSGGIPSPSLSNTNLAAAGGIASLIAASHNVMPVGPSTLTPAIPKFKLSTQPTLRELPLSSLAPDTLANPPASTNLSSNAVMVNCERGVGVGDIRTASAMSSSIMANIWGSSNWGILNKMVRGEVIPPIEGPQDFFDPSNTQSQSVESSVKALEPASDSIKVPDPVEIAHSAARVATRSLSPRPDMDVENDKAPEPQLNLAHDASASYYPLQLKIQDAQFRLLFPNIAQEEKLVYVFRATLSLNDQQEFPGRVYVTATNMYIYSNHLGLVMISEIALDSIIGITATPRRDSDVLFLHLVETDKNIGLRCLILKTFLEPLNLLQRRLKYLVQNSRSHEAIDLESVMKGLINVAKADSAGSLSLGSYDDMPTDTLSDNGLLKWSSSQRDHSQLQAKVIADSGFPITTEKPDEGKGAAKVKRVLPPQSVEYVPDGMDRLAVEQIFDISPKSLFHIMFGDKSAIWQLLYHKRHAQRTSPNVYASIKL